MKILVVDDEQPARDRLKQLLDDEPDYEVVGEAANGRAAIERTAELQPDILLLDLHLPGMSGLEALRWIKEYSADTEVIILTQSDKVSEVDRALREGASGYLLKSATLKEIIAGIQVVRQGGASLDPEVARYLLHALQRQPSPAPSAKTLSDREHEILTLLGEGFVKKEIADQLSISITTVAYHVKHIYQKLDVVNAPAAINKAYKSGILNPENKD